MITRDLLSFAARALGKERRRTLLSLLGVAIGVASVVVLTALGEGARRFVLAQFETLGSNVLAVMPGKIETTGGIPGFGGVPNDLSIADAQALDRSLPGALRVVPLSMGNDTLAHGDKSRQAIVIGATTDVQWTHDVAVARGRFLPEAPWDRGAPVVVLGRTLERELFPGETALGKVVRIGGWRMRVVGVLAAKGVHFGIDWDEVAFVPVATGMRMFNRSSLFRIVVQGRAGTDLEALERRIVALLAERHGEEDVTVVSPDAMLGSLTSILGILTLALVGIAAVSLSVAGIGIMNVMLVSVSERTREIGLLKALGASPRDILSAFVAEAVLLSTTGGMLGLAVGFGAVATVSSVFPSFPVHAPAWAAASALGVSIAVGGVFGVLPARRAVRLDPVAALAKR